MRKISILKCVGWPDWENDDHKNFLLGPICEFTEISDEDFDVLCRNLYHAFGGINRENYMIIEQVEPIQIGPMVQGLREFEEKQKEKQAAQKAAALKRAKKRAEKKKSQDIEALEKKLRQLKGE